MRDYRTNQIDRDALISALQQGDYHQMYGGGGQGGTYSPGASFEDLTGQYDRRNEGQGGALRGAASGASAGAAAGSIVPGIGTLAGAAVGGLGGALIGAFTKNAPTARTDFAVQDARNALQDAYRSYLGREASADELNAQLAGQGLKPGDRWVGEAGLRSVIDSIRQSEEARRYQPGASPAAGAAGGAAGGGVDLGAGVAPGGTFTGGSGALVDPYALAPEADLAGVMQGGQRYTDYDASTGRVGTAGSSLGGFAGAGFDFAQDPGNRDIGKSAKYAFAHLSEQAAAAGAQMPTTKEAAEAWFSQYIAPGMNQLGFTVHQVVGDKAFVSTREFPQGQWIDFLGNAGGDNPQLWWGAENPGEMAAGGGGGPRPGGGGGGTGLLPTDITSSDLFERLLAEARAAANGQGPGASTLDRNALIDLLVA